MHPEFTPEFANRLIAWQRAHGRHDLPWQGGSDPYPIWVSEIMLQQTQVETVIPYYQRFLASFPDIASLAAASQDQVMALWSGLGYYSRARNLHAAAMRVVADHGGRFPRAMEAIIALPGIGRSTAAAIATFAYQDREAILDGNVKRVLSRVFGVAGRPGNRVVEERLWTLAEGLLPETDVRAYTQGLMDLGATLCTRARPRCQDCPCADDCIANREGRQHELPESRRKKTVPEKATAMLVLLRAGEVLLEKRPPTGIWGGLWSLPECSPEEDPHQAAGRWGCAVVAEEGDLPAFTHTFTHFRLSIHPRLLRVNAVAAAAEPGWVWLALADVAGAALPTPVRRILSSLVETG